MNNLRSALGELAYRELAKILKRITNGGSGGSNIIELNCTEDMPFGVFVNNDENLMVYTDVEFSGEVSEKDKQFYTNLINNNKNVCNFFIENYNNNKPTGVVFVMGDDKILCPAYVTINRINGEVNSITVGMNDTNTLFKIPVTIADGKAVMSKLTYIVGGK